MNALWLSCIALPGKNGALPRPHSGPVAVATTIVNMNIIKELVSCHDISVDLLNVFPVRVFPNSRDLIVRKRVFQINTKFNLNDVGFLNLPLVNHVSKGFQLTRLARRWAMAHQGSGIVFVYSIHSPFLFAATAAKRLNKKLHLCLVVPDLPEYMDIELDKKPIKRLLKKIDAKIINLLLRNVDSYVLFSQYMADQLPMADKPRIVMEGIVNPGDFPEENRKKAIPANLKIIMYSGSLQPRYGIPNLLRAFTSISDPDYRLWITGDGNAREMIEVAQKADPRIQYWGFVADRERVIQMQQEATLLVNMRLPSETQSAYCFPSKLIEYMASGTPALTYKIPGIPAEYDDYLFFMDDEDPLAMASRMQNILNMPQMKLKEMGNRARQFVFFRKNSKVQTDRILSMIGNSFYGC